VRGARATVRRAGRIVRRQTRTATRVTRPRQDHRQEEQASDPSGHDRGQIARMVAEVGIHVNEEIEKHSFGKGNGFQKMPNVG
jgi:hypothetical protein